MNSGEKPDPSSSSADKRPFTSTLPYVGRRIPAISCSSVLLPEPFEPTTPNASPLFTLKLTSRNAHRLFSLPSRGANTWRKRDHCDSLRG